MDTNPGEGTQFTVSPFEPFARFIVFALNFLTSVIIQIILVTISEI